MSNEDLVQSLSKVAEATKKVGFPVTKPPQNLLDTLPSTSGVGLEIFQSLKEKESSNSNMSGDLSDDEEGYVLVQASPNTSVEDIVSKVFGDVTKASAGKQFLIGGATGWASGYLANRVGKMAAFTLAGSLLILQVAQYNGYVTVDWTKVQRAMTKAKATARKAMIRHKNSVAEKAYTFYEENIFLASGFAGGFLFGFLF